MRKLLSLLFFAVLMSCQSSDTSTVMEQPDPTKLQKVIWYPDGPAEKHWNFNADGLLAEVTTPDGSVLQTFQYDGNHRLIAVVGQGYSKSFGYDDANFLTSIDETPVVYSYDATGGKYTRPLDVPDGAEPDLFPYQSEVLINLEGLTRKSTHFYGDPAAGTGFQTTEASATFVNGNMTHIYRGDDTEENYEFDEQVNPLKEALLPICRAMIGSIVWICGDYYSDNNVTQQRYAPEDPESLTYFYNYNSLGLPIERVSQFNYLGVPEGGTSVNARYYYQGDVIP